MKKFREYLNEEMMPYAQTEKGFVGVDNGPVRDNINIHLASITAKPYATPYHAMEMVRKVLAVFSIFPPSTNFLDGDSGHEVFQINQFGNKYGMTNDGTTVDKSFDPYYVYFEYAMNDKGSFDVFCEIVDEEELEEILSDVESELEGADTTTGDGKDAEDSFDEYKSDNQVNEEKDPCWKGYEMIGMKKKGGKKVPNCVPVSEALFGGKKWKRKQNPNNATTKKSEEEMDNAMKDASSKIADSKGSNRKWQIRKMNVAYKMKANKLNKDASKS